MSAILTDIANSNIEGISATAGDLSSLQSSLSDISNKNELLAEKQARQLEQMKEIEDKEKLILTRSRMLQIAQDRNSYKKKVIYSLIALILFIFIGTVMLYVLFTRKGAMANAAKINK